MLIPQLRLRRFRSSRPARGRAAGWLLLSLGGALLVVPPAPSARAQVVVVGGSAADRRNIDGVLQGALRGLTLPDSPVTIEIVSSRRMDAIVAQTSSGDDSDPSTASGSADTPLPSQWQRQASPAGAGAATSTDPYPTASGSQDADADASADAGPIDGIYTPADDLDDLRSIATNGGAAVPEGTALITLLSGEETRAFDIALAHEYGHHVWNAFLARRDHREYRRLYAAQSDAGALVSEYAFDSPEEGFAESFAYFLLDPKRLQRRDAASYRYMQALAGRLRAACQPSAPADAPDNGH